MFKLVKILNGRINQGEPVRLPCAEKTAELGDALVFENGNITLYDPAYDSGKMPSFICCEHHDVSRSGKHTILAMPVSPDMIFEVPVTESPKELVPGIKVTLADSKSVTATTDGGVATVWDTCGSSEIGDKIEVRFI